MTPLFCDASNAPTRSGRRATSGSIGPDVIGLCRCASVRRLTALAALCLLSAGPAAAGDGDSDYVVIKAGRVITVAGQEFAPGLVVIEDGKVSLVGGTKLEYPPGSKIIDAPHETVMPGLIYARSRHGLAGYSRSGVHGDQKASDEVYVGAIDFDDLVEAGYTTVCFTPDGSGIPGMASAFRTLGPEESRSLADSAYLHVKLDWTGKDKATLRGAFEKAKAEIEKVKKAREEWEKKQKEAAEKKAKEDVEGEGTPDDEKEKDDGAVSRPSRAVVENKPETSDGTEKKDESEPEAFKPPPIDPKYQPLVDLIEKKEGARMMIQLTGASDLHHLDDVLKPYDSLAHSLYLATAHSVDYDYVVDALGERKAQVLLRPWIHYLPWTTFRYNLMARLDAAGCEVSTLPMNDTRADYLGVRARLADLVRSGLSREAAIKSLTLHPAKAIGLGERLGSIEKGKDADFVFMSGDPLDPHTEVRRVMILGEVVWTADGP